MAKPVIKAPTQDQKVKALMRELSMKKEQMFLGILYNSINAGEKASEELVDKSLQLADYALEKLFSAPVEEVKEAQE